MIRRAATRYDTLILAADVGGTNTSIAIVGTGAGRFEIVARYRTSTPRLGCFEDGLREALSSFRAELNLRELALCCVSAAGPVVGDECRLTNVPWAIRRSELERVTGVNSYLVNDFTAISYAVPLLAPDNPEQVTRLPVPGAPGASSSNPAPGFVSGQDGIAAVIGAGTGLGVGFVVHERGEFRAWPSEGGHTDLAPYDDRSDALVAYLRRELGGRPDWEHAVSGTGIANLFAFLRRHEFAEHRSDALDRIEAAPSRERAALISEAADHDPLCRATIEFFVELYARAASGVALQLLPSAGVYLAGGIAPKNQRFFIEDDRFMRSFSATYQSGLREILSATPVAIINDYEISLYGAAHAGTVLDRRPDRKPDHRPE